MLWPPLKPPRFRRWEIHGAENPLIGNLATVRFNRVADPGPNGSTHVAKHLSRHRSQFQPPRGAHTVSRHHHQIRSLMTNHVVNHASRFT